LRNSGGKKIHVPYRPKMVVGKDVRKRGLHRGGQQSKLYKNKEKKKFIIS